MLASKECSYDISFGLVEMLTAITKFKKQEVWSILADETQVCFDRMDKKGMDESWRWITFPTTEVRMKIKVNRSDQSHIDGRWIAKTTYRCNIKFDPNATETFTSKEVEEFLIENILLGVE